MTALTRSLTSIATPVLDALTWPHGPDRYLQQLNPAWGLREVRVEVTAIRHPTPGCATLLLRPNRAWRGFSAGQHVQLAVEIDGALRRRCYSVVTSEHDRSGLLELTVHAEPDGRVSNQLQRLRRGAVLGLSQAQGPFTLPSPRPDRMLLISGGSGITPVMSMLRTLRDEGRAGSVTFLHYARGAADVAYREELDALAESGVRVLRSYTRSGGGELSGRFDPSHVDGLGDVPAWVCGPASLVESVRAQWTGPARLRTEYFTPPTPVAVPDDGEPHGEVEFAGSGKRVANTGAPLLEQAEAAGLKAEFGCRMGICFSCTRRKTAGTVRQLNTGALSTEPDSDIQLCVTVPVGDVRIDL
ncbi:MAG: ferredoxin reductase [Pseudonocardiaceae bacterium]